MGAEYVDPDPVVEAKRQAARASAGDDGERAPRPVDGEVEAAAKKRPRRR